MKLSRKEESRQQKSLTPKHRKVLSDRAVSSLIAGQRGYHSARTADDVRVLGFQGAPACAPALVIPLRGFDGEVWAHQIRPDSPRERNGKSVKYEIPARTRLRLDVPPGCGAKLGDPDVDLWVTESPIKGDALASENVCVIDILGVWGWRGTNEHGGKTPLADFQKVAWNDRTVYLAFDSDAATNPHVAHSLRELADFLENEDAKVKVVVLPPGKDGAKQGVDDFLAAGGTVDALKRLAVDKVPTPAGGVPVADELKDLAPPGPAGLVVPRGYRLRSDGVWREGKDHDERVTPAPVLVVGRQRSTDGDESLTLAWRQDGQWREETVAREDAADGRRLVKLAARGFPVTSAGQRHVVQFIQAFEASNAAVLTPTQTSKQLGWVEAGERRGFLWGTKLLRPAAEKDDPPWVSFRPGDVGDTQLAGGFRRKGEFDLWQKTVAPVAKYPRVLLGLYASLASPLLEALGVQPFLLHWAFSTSTGKTVALRVAASVWGQPDECAKGSVVRSWECTEVWAQRHLALLRHLPAFLDETHRARDPGLIALVVYAAAGGQDRSRGSLAGTQVVATWTSVILSTGEQRLSDLASGDQGGLSARVVEVFGAPFEGASADEYVVDPNKLFQNFGTAGPRWIRWLLNHWSPDTWRRRYAKTLAEYHARAGTNPYLRRVATYLAAMTTAGRLAHEAKILPWHFTDPVDKLWDSLAAETDSADKARHALEFVWAWTQRNSLKFFTGGTLVGSTPDRGYKSLQPHDGWAGLWPRRDADWIAVGFFRDKIDELLKRGGFNASAMLKQWSALGWLRNDTGRVDQQLRVGSTKMRQIILRRRALLGLKTVAVSGAVEATRDQKSLRSKQKSVH